MDPAIFSPQAPGCLVAIYDGNLAFVPTPLPPRLEFTHELAGRLADAANGVGLLAGTGRNLTNPALLIAPYLRREAVLSSRIEGTVSTLDDLYKDEATDKVGSVEARTFGRSAMTCSLTNMAWTALTPSL